MKQFRRCPFAALVLVPLVAAVALASGCAPGRPVPAPGEKPSVRLAAAERAADAAPLDAMLQAKAGFLRLLIGSDPRGASARFQRAGEAARTSGDAEAAALALAGEAEIADDRLEPESAERWARALERA
ncbi:MAG TPA: hypothetical protein VN883_10675, partial [Myxococcales bacterium]|nr:hypothetical protein [Myxococcales bacterium]